MQFGESICHGSLLPYFQYLASANFAREVTQMLSINQGPEFFDNCQKDALNYNSFQSFSEKILKAQAEK